jgi:hypothetical protein
MIESLISSGPGQFALAPNAIAKHYPRSQYHVERIGKRFEPRWVEPAE